jgi:hypothetical protein
MLCVCVCVYIYIYIYIYVNLYMCIHRLRVPQQQFRSSFSARRDVHHAARTAARCLQQYELNVPILHPHSSGCAAQIQPLTEHKLPLGTLHIKNGGGGLSQPVSDRILYIYSTSILTELSQTCYTNSVFFPQNVMYLFHNEFSFCRMKYSHFT